MPGDVNSAVTTIGDGGKVRIPASIRDRLDIESGDKLRWSIDEEGDLSVEVRRQRYGVFDDFEGVPMGGDGLETHDLAGYEDDPAFSEDS
ncbi:AbrB/MazE/SpoVT family DNA-binding domain-containing protein [Halomicrobium salinisoli]|uniref:AbrB/MazE/SpoVT family DNA-binding domain-containing protein n=1 Tax=Halomicrobium salinisoli TaxID=2878391 RepID=UPI001CF0B24E|nr:AbrB/MazE/SpoVT family DNA-binding domain-containing protein [Halomicrobium salinisoli]